MIKKAYHYLFYKLYKFSEAAPSRWLSDWKAELALDMLWLFLCLSVFVYYTVFTKQVVNFGDGKFVSILLIIFISLPNYFLFHHKNQWKKIVQKFDKLPKRANRIGGGLVLSFVLFVITNLIFSFYLMSQIKRL